MANGSHGPPGLYALVAVALLFNIEVEIVLLQVPALENTMKKGAAIYHFVVDISHDFKD